jgi:hypothetical protein
MELMGVVNKGKKFGLMADKEIEFFFVANKIPNLFSG